MFGMRSGRAGAVGNQTLLSQALSILRRPGLTSHVYIPGANGVSVSGLTAGNYLDTNGSTGYAAVDALDGLVLDGMGSLGSELVTNGDFSSAIGWTLAGNWAIAGGVATHTSSGGLDNLQQLGILTVGNVYRINVDVNAITGTLTLMCGTGSTFVVSGVGTTVIYLTCATSANLLLQASVGGTCTIDNVSVKQVTGIHATASGAARPTLRRGSVNLLVQSGFINSAVGPSPNPSAWNITGSGNAGSAVLSAEIVAGYSCQPYRLVSATSGIHGIQQLVSITANTPYTQSCYIRVPSGSVVDGGGLYCYYGGGTPSGLTIATASQLNAQPKDTWVRWSATVTFTVLPTYVGAVFCMSSATNACTFDIAALQLETGSTASDYSPTTTAAASNPNAGRYSWSFDGTDSLALGSVPFQMSDDHCIIGGAASTSNLSPQTIACCYVGTTERACQIRASTGDATVYWIDTAATVNYVAYNDASPVKVVTGFRRAGTFGMRLNGVLRGTTPVTVGASSLTSAAIGARGGVEPLTGSIGPVIAIKGTVTDAELLTLERFVASLTPNAPTF